VGDFFQLFVTFSEYLKDLDATSSQLGSLCGSFRDIAFETTPSTFGKLKPCAFHAFQISIKYSISSAKMFQLDAIYYQSCV
jgi:hypothetical protein